MFSISNTDSWFYLNLFAINMIDKVIPFILVCAFTLLFGGIYRIIKSKLDKKEKDTE